MLKGDTIGCWIVSPFNITNAGVNIIFCRCFSEGVASRSIFVLGFEADLATLAYFWRLHQFVDSFKDNFELMIVFLFHLRQFTSKTFVRGKKFKKSYKGADDKNAGIDSSMRIQDRCRHDSAMLGEGEGRC